MVNEMSNRILIDCSYIDFNKQPSGIPRVVLNYINEGYKWSKKRNIPLLPVVITSNGPYLVEPLPGEFSPTYLHKVIELSKKYNINEIKNVGVASGDIIFCPAYWHDIPSDTFKIYKERGGKVVILVHDILPISHKDYYDSPWREEVFEKNFIQALSYSDLMCTVSHYTADCIIDYCDRKRIKSPKIIVAYNGFSSLASDQVINKISKNSYRPCIERSELRLIKEAKPFIMVGSIEPKKGHIPVIEAFENLWEAGFSYPLAIIGRKGWKYDRILEKINNSKFFQKKLFLFEDFDDIDLYMSYLYSTGLIFSSIAEGFGLPMIEAASVGCPVVAYDTPITREILNTYGFFYSGLTSFFDALNRCLEIKERLSPKIWPEWSELVGSLFDSFIENFAEHGSSTPPEAL